MSEPEFAPCRATESCRLSCWEAGDGEAIVALVEAGGHPSRAHALLAARRRVIVFAMPAEAETPQAVARQVGDGLSALGIARFDLIAEGAGTAAALWAALARQTALGSVVLAAPVGPADDAFREMTRPVLLLQGTVDRSDTGERYRALLPDCHFMLVYDAGGAIGAERPEALAFIAGEFFERGDLFLVSRESGVVLP